MFLQGFACGYHPKVREKLIKKNRPYRNWFCKVCFLFTGFYKNSLSIISAQFYVAGAHLDQDS
jgi:hypothetical protein